MNPLEKTGVIPAVGERSSLSDPDGLGWWGLGGLEVQKTRTVIRSAADGYLALSRDITLDALGPPSLNGISVAVGWEMVGYPALLKCRVVHVRNRLPQKTERKTYNRVVMPERKRTRQPNSTSPPGMNTVERI